MTRKVKTLKIDALRAEANKVFATSEDCYADGRKHIATFIEKILMDTKNYRGFAYLPQDKVAPGKSYGIEFTGNEPKFHDQTRIEFF